MLRFHHVSKSFDDRPALVDVTMSFQAGSRTAVVGVNGAGKSTLLRIAAGLLDPDAGAVHRDPGVSATYVPQDYAVAGLQTVDAYLRERAGVLTVERRLSALERAMAAGDVAAADAYVAATDLYVARGGYELDGRIERALDQLELAPSLRERPLAELSGGQQVRVGLAGVLASRFDCYVLDEPTNNLDLGALALLERFVSSAAATFVVVSHDRRFLDVTATDVVEIDEHSHSASRYGVGFAEYRELRERELAARSARYAAYLAEVGRLKAAINRQRAVASRDTDSRPRRDNDKFAGAFLAQRKAAQAAGAMQRLQRRLDRVDVVEQPRTGWDLRLDLSAARRSGDLVAALEGVRKHYGRFTLGPLSLTLHWRDRLALQGHNGAGKSVLLSLLTGGVAPDDGRVRRGAGVRLGVLRQSGANLAGYGSGLAVLRSHVETSEEAARTLLAKFDLGAGHALRPVATYSPGERCRLGLAILMAQGANCLILDEPTNHLDMEASEEFEQALQGFDGTLVVVSHDREFLDRVGVTRRLELADGAVVANDVA